MVRTLIIRAAVAVLVVTLLPSPVSACLNCKYSPNGWGFCRGNYMTGATTCNEVVIDDFNGTTGCEFPLGYDCRNGGTRVDGGGACWWTDVYGNCII